tara:strand:- start:337 stop:471 length:135 start_codon:yes stop_codon:yes gene_type:complete
LKKIEKNFAQKIIALFFSHHTAFFWRLHMGMYYYTFFSQGGKKK